MIVPELLTYSWKSTVNKTGSIYDNRKDVCVELREIIVWISESVFVLEISIVSKQLQFPVQKVYLCIYEEIRLQLKPLQVLLF